jgi:hypothetical protein
MIAWPVAVRWALLFFLCFRLAPSPSLLSTSSFYTDSLFLIMFCLSTPNLTQLRTPFSRLDHRDQSSPSPRMTFFRQSPFTSTLSCDPVILLPSQRKLCFTSSIFGLTITGLRPSYRVDTRLGTLWVGQPSIIFNDDTLLWKKKRK